MINLIPKEEKNKMVRGFYYRLAVVYLLALSFPILIGAIVIVPSHFLVYIKSDLANKKLEAQKAEPVPIPDQKTLATIADTNHKLSLVETAQNNKFIFSARVINAIVLKKTPNIKITGISYENNFLPASEEPEDPENPKEVVEPRKISIQGTAPSREALLLFRRALEDDVNFKSVDLPISNFIKGSNIQFYLSLIPS